MSAVRRFNVVVLGAAIVGVSTAPHLQARGRSTLLLDCYEPGEEASLGQRRVDRAFRRHSLCIPPAVGKAVAVFTEPAVRCPL